MNESYALPLFLFGTVVITAFAVTIVVVLVVYTRRHVKTKLERQRLESQYNEELLRTRIEVQEQSLQNVSREIHDGIGQELSLGRMQLAALKPHIATEEGGRLLQDNLDMLKKSIKNLRLLSHSLNTGLIERKGLEDALRTEIERLKSFTMLKCDLVITGEYKDLSPETDLLLFRVAQESIQNVLKHAEATELTVHLEYGDSNIHLRILDNGSGVTAKQVESAGLGITSMHQRADMLKGNLSVKALNPRGTEVSLTAPYNP